jgi:signal transduction histidine kinase
MDNKNRDRYEILRQLAVAGASGAELERTVRLALGQAAELVGLQAAAVYLWDEQMAVTLSVAWAGSDADEDRLAALEEDLLRDLRRKNDLLSAYMSFGGEAPCHSFTLPLRHGNTVFGAVIGLQQGERTLVDEDVFLEALCAAITLHVVAGGGVESMPRDRLDQERLTAIIETAVTVNHEVNNPLTAILGNVQLLLMKRDDLDPDIKRKLEVIEESASKIRDVTQKMLRLTSARSVDYIPGTSMIDLSGPEGKNDKPET